MTAKSLFAKLIIHAALIAGGIAFLFPLLWMFSTSIKPISQAMQMPPQALPFKELVKGVDGREYPAGRYKEVANEERTVVALVARQGDKTVIDVDTAAGGKERRTVDAKLVTAPGIWRWENYVDAVTYKARVLGYIPFARYARNTLYLVILSVIGTVLSNSLVAYGFARINWPGRDWAFGLTIATMMIPFSVLVVPQYVVFKTLGWVGSPKPLWVPAFFGSAFNIFLLRQFFKSLPFELSDAAKIDGCNEFTIYKDVILPLAKPALAVVALFNFLAVWNDFQGPLIYLTDQKTYTLAYGLQAYQSQHGGTQWPLLMAASTIVVAPVIVMFFLAQKTFIQGITVTGMKN